jgi:hypothetical protein
MLHRKDLTRLNLPCDLALNMRIAARDIGICFMSQMSKSFPDEVDQRQWDEVCRRAEAIRDFLHRGHKVLRTHGFS